MYGLKASHVVDMARKYKNYQEKSKLGTRTQMWNFHWSPGYNNYTIWAMLYTDYVNRNFQGQAWCAMFGSDIFVLALMERGLSQNDAVKAAKDLLSGDLPYNCQQFVNQHLEDKRLDHKPTVGATVIFWTGKKYGHFGIVSSVDSNGNGFTSVEGNTSGGADKVDPDGGAVCEKWHHLDGKTYFWHPAYDSETEKPELIMYGVSTGRKGLEVVGAEALFVRDSAATGKTIGELKKGTMVKPIRKCFVNGKPWYQIAYGTGVGWISARFLSGWVLEDNALWWYVQIGYRFTVNAWQQIDGIYYYFDSTGYMATSRWILDSGAYYYVTKSGEMARNVYVKSSDQNLYYWVGDDGAWQPEWDTKIPDLDKYQLAE